MSTWDRLGAQVAPWREVLPNGELSSETYGGAASTFWRQQQRHKLWSWRPPRNAAALRSIGPLADFVFPDGKRNPDVPDSEVDVVSWIVHGGCTRREAAERMGVSLETVRSYLKRLRKRAAKARKDERLALIRRVCK